MRERETVFYLLPKVALIQQLSFSSSRMFPNAATFCVFRVGSAKGSFQTTTCSRNSRKQPFFFRREAREAAEVMTELDFEDKKGMASVHLTRPSALLKGYGSRALPDPAEAFRGVTASPLSVPELPFLPLPAGPIPVYGILQSAVGHISHPACQPVRRSLVFSPAAKHSGGM